MSSGPANPDSTTPVRATLTGPWPGREPFAAARAVVAELGAPHLPVVAELPDRGPGADAVGRTAAMLEELTVDLQPHGWRLHPASFGAPGLDHRRAVCALRSDLDALADAAGTAGVQLEELVLRVAGPVSLAAQLWLPGGERALSDVGARRDVTDALAAGLGAQLAAVRAATGAMRLTVVLEEPWVVAALSGTLPTASGYRTVRSLPRSEVRQSWSAVSTALLTAGAAGLYLAPGRTDGSGTGTVESWGWTELGSLVIESLPARGREQEAVVPTETGLVLPLVPMDGAGADPARWEQVAGWVETGRTVMLRLPPPTGAVTGAPVGAEARRAGRLVAGAWHRLGMPTEQLGSLVLCGPDCSALTPERARLVTAGVVGAAEDLERRREDGVL